MATIHCKVITPQAQLLDQEIRMAILPAWDGQYGVLPNHAPVVGKLGIGEMRIDFPDSGSARGGRRSYLVEDGFFQMIENRLTILASRAVPAETLSRSEAEAELREAQAREKPTDAAESESLRRDIKRAQLKVRMTSGGKGI